MDQVLLYIGYVLAGFFGVGLPTLRYLYVSKGNYLKVIPVNIISSLNFVLFTKMIVDDNYTFLILNVIGSSIAVFLLAHKESKNEI